MDYSADERQAAAEKVAAFTAYPYAVTPSQLDVSIALQCALTRTEGQRDALRESLAAMLADAEMVARNSYGPSKHIDREWKRVEPSQFKIVIAARAALSQAGETAK